MGHTAQRPGGDAAVVRVPGVPGKALAMSSDCTPRYVFADPKQGGAQAVAESWRNITAVGALPLAITDNMNFGNPQRPEIMGQFALSIEGMADACRALDYPVISGNVSLYNETNGKGILPTPTIGGVGLMKNVDRMATVAFKAAGETVLVLGESKGWLGQSIYLREMQGREEGAPPPVDLASERRNGDFVRGLIVAGEVVTCHDVSDGGLLVAVADMALAGGVGVALTTPQSDVPSHGYWFGEDQARYVIAVPAAAAAGIEAKAKAAGVPVERIGSTVGADVVLDGRKMSIRDLKQSHEAFLPTLMGAA